MKNTIKNKRGLKTALFALILLICLSVPSFAFSFAPTDGDYTIYVQSLTSGQIYAYGYSTASTDDIEYSFDYSLCVFRPENDIQLLFANLSTSAFYFGVWNGSSYRDATNAEINYLLDAYGSWKQQITTETNSLRDYAYNIGIRDGVNSPSNISYELGYSAGVNEGNVAKNYLLTIFSAPSYILSNVFSFEIFGLNFYVLVCFVLTIGVVGLVLKKIL